MSENALPTIRKLRHTPLRDLLRCRISGRLDWKSAVTAANLPSTAAELIRAVVKRTRLWPLEKTAVAEELIAHFTDGLAAGRTPEQLTEDFGDGRIAAKLVRRAKRRGRPWPWHVLNFAVRVMAVVFAIYAVLLIRFCLAQPRPSVDYIAKQNVTVSGIAGADRAWPLWRRAILACSDSAKGGKVVFSEAVVGTKGEKPTWSKTVTWLDEHAAGMEIARAAGRKPAMGFILGPTGSAADPSLGWSFADQTTTEPLMSISLPHLNYLRKMSDFLSLDARLAAEHTEGARVEADLLAMLGLGRQLRGSDSFLVIQWLGLELSDEALRRLQSVLFTHPGALTDDQLVRLAHALSGPRVAADLLTFRGDRDIFDDIVQRAYTDDGHGDGHLTLAGLHFIAKLNLMNPESDPGLLPGWAEAPTLPLFAASRAQVLAKYDRLQDKAEANLRRPIREVDLSAVKSQITALMYSRVSRLRFALLYKLMPAVPMSQEACEKYLGERDGVVVGIALELYRRHDGHYPASLGQLTPELLPEIPVDRITGDPVKYKLIDGEPIVYSVGADRIDDGGTPPAKNDIKATFFNTRPCSWGIDPKDAARGDWLLFAPQSPDANDP
jgi:hypothetical protein